jgi:ribosomal protein S18 acetylase RimI-like enzyme
VSHLAEPVPPTGVTLRRADAADAGFLRDLARSAYAHYVERVGREPMPMVDDYDRVVAEDECWVVARDGEDIGYLVLRLEDDHLLLNNVAVARAQQGRGIGRYLLDFTEARARAQQRDEVRLYTHVTMVENIALYTRHGYVETHREDDSGFRRVFMAKQLGDQPLDDAGGGGGGGGGGCGGGGGGGVVGGGGGLPG